LTHDDVRRIAREEGLGRDTDALLDSVRPGWRLEVRRGVTPLGGSRIGGDPDLAADEPWPLNHRGVPMTFLAQIDVDALPELDEAWTAHAVHLPGTERPRPARARRA